MSEETRRWIFDLVLVAVVVATLTLCGIHEAAAYFRNDTNYVSAVSAFSALAAAVFTAAAAIAALVYVVLTHRLWRENASQVEAQRRGAETALMQGLMIEYDRLRDSIGVVQEFFTQHGPNEALNVFRAGRIAPDRNNDIVQSVDPARFRVSRFFVRIRKLALAGYLDRRLIFTALGRAAVEDVFLRQIDPLDQVISMADHSRATSLTQSFSLRLLSNFDARSRGERDRRSGSAQRSNA